MKTTYGSRASFNRPFPGNNLVPPQSGVSLQTIVNQLLTALMSVAYHNNSIVTNDISRNIQLAKSKASVAPVIRDLLASVIRNSRNGQIFISAERFRDIVILQVQDRNNYNGYALASALKHLEQDASSQDACMTVDGIQQKVVTVSLSFPADNCNGAYTY